MRFEFQCAAGGAGGHRVDFGYVFASGGYRRRGDRDRLDDDGAIEVLLNGRNVALVRVGEGDAGGDGAAAPVSIGTINPYTNPEYYVGHVLDGGAVSAHGFTVELGPYYAGEGATTAAEEEARRRQRRRRRRRQRRRRRR